MKEAMKGKSNSKNITEKIIERNRIGF